MNLHLLFDILKVILKHFKCLLFSVQTLMKETEFIKQTKDKQISEMRKITDESNEARRNDFDKRVGTSVKVQDMTFFTHFSDGRPKSISFSFVTVLH